MRRSEKDMRSVRRLEGLDSSAAADLTKTIRDRKQRRVPVRAATAEGAGRVTNGTRRTRHAQGPRATAPSAVRAWDPVSRDQALHGEPGRTCELPAAGADVPVGGGGGRADLPAARAERGARLPRGRRADRSVRPVADRRARDRGERRRDRRGAAPVHRRAGTAPLAARLDAARHLRPRHRAARRLRRRARGARRAVRRGAQRQRRHRHHAGALGDRRRPAIAGGTRGSGHRLRQPRLRGAALSGHRGGRHPRADAAAGIGRRRPRRALARRRGALHGQGARRDRRRGARRPLRPQPVLPPARRQRAPAR